MEAIYITQENVVLHRCAEHLIIKKRGRKVGTIPLANVKTIVLLSGIQLTSAALDILFARNIDVVFTSRSGVIKGRIYAQTGGGAITRLAQLSAFINPQKRLAIAKVIVAAKILNQSSLISKNIKYYPLEIYKTGIKSIGEHFVKLEKSKSIEMVMGIEGVCARIYWHCFRQLLKEALFLRRDFRPAPDIVNSALNLGYSFLANEITTCLAANKFDVEIGFLHSVHYGRNSLTLDIMEEFRSPFVDAWLLALFNRRILNENCFQGVNKGFYLNDIGFQKFCAHYHTHINKGGWRRKFQNQAFDLKKSLLEEGAYHPYIHE